MAASKYLDSDDEFGYDLSVEDEESLLQLTCDNTAPLYATAKPSNLVDSVPSKTATVTSATQLAPVSGSQVPRRDDRPATTRIPSDAAIDLGVPAEALPSPVSLDEDVTYPDLSRVLSDVDKAAQSSEPEAKASRRPPRSLASADRKALDQDDRSPLQRFRSYPRRPMTVTDLTAGAWCELQYWYTLTRLPGGRRTKTAAMRQGSKVHQALEDEVHTTVKIEILTKEDGFGLKLWNLVQGLRTLRDTGLTRELEVWGTIDGTFVNGVIDSVSYDNPNPDFQEELSSQESQVDHEQSRLTDFFPPREDKSKRRKQVKAYIADVKTRGSARPVTNVLLRPAKIQLLLYYRFLADMAAGRLDFFKLFRRYGLDADDTFSDAFIAQIGSLHDDIFVDASMSIDENPQSSGQAPEGGPNSSWSTEPESSHDGPDLLRYKTLRELVPLIQQELELTFPEGEDSLGHILRVQYVHRNDGKQINVHDFPVSKQALENFLGDYMPWWKGEREAQGVSIEEAFKCRTCEFASDCTWRQEIDEEMVRKAQEKMRAKRTNGY